MEPSPEQDLVDNDTQQNEIELHVSKDIQQTTATTATATETATVTDNEQQNPNSNDNDSNPIDIEQEMQKKTSKHKARPTFSGVLNKQVTWKDFFEFYNVARIGIAAIIAILIMLTYFGLALAINPNRCKIVVPEWGTIWLQPFLNRTTFSYRLSLIAIPAIKIFGHEWSWTHLKTNMTVLLAIVIIFTLWLISGFFPSTFMGVYFSVVWICIFIGGGIYIFVLGGGFYTFWIMFPFGIAVMLLLLLIAGGQILFEQFINPENPYTFSIAYPMYLIAFEQVLAKFYLYQLPYKWGKLCTCCCNKGNIALFT